MGLSVPEHPGKRAREDILCPRCAKVIPSDAPRRLCPECLLLLCFGTDREWVEEDVEVKTDENTGKPIIWFGDYELLAEMGRGGMGIVYKARQISLNRVVALKMMTPARLLSKSDLERFQSEARTIAALDHPNILPVYDFGRKAAQCFYSMRLVEGGSLAERLARGEFRPVERQEQIAQLLAAVARAVHYAHQRGVIHRDLKPANILIDSGGRPYVADFGVAKLIDGASELTQTHTVFGTPSYMAPEQAGGGTRQLTAAADVYSLGAVLYELMTGRPPFLGETAMAVLMQIAQDEPIAPRRLNPVIAHDLENICLKCLDKKPSGRYASAGELADDLERFLRGEPTRARPLGPVARVGRWRRRKPLIAALVAAIGLTFLVGTSVSLWLAHRAGKLALAAENSNRQLRQTLVRLNLDRAQQAFNRENFPQAISHIAYLLHQQPDNPVATSWIRVMANAFIPLPLTEAIDLKPGKSKLLVFSPDGETVLAADEKGRVNLVPLEGGAPLIQKQFPASVRAAEFAADGKTLLVIAGDGLYLWDGRTNSGATQANCLLTNVSVAHFSPDGLSIAAATLAGQISLWDTQPPKQVWEVDGHTSNVTALAWSPDRAIILTGGEDKFARMWSVLHGTKKWESNFQTPVRAAAFSADGSRFAYGGRNGATLICDSQSCQPLSPILALGEAVQAVIFNPASPQLMVMGTQGLLQFWNIADVRTPRSAKPFPTGGTLAQAPYSRDGQLFAARSRERTGLLWQSAPLRLLPSPICEDGRVDCIAISPDGHRAAVLSGKGTLRFWKIPPRQQSEGVLRATNGIRRAAFCGNSGRIAILNDRREITLWDVADQPPSEGRHFQPVASLADSVGGFQSSLEGRWIATWKSDEFLIWPANASLANAPRPALRIAVSGRPTAVTFSASGSHIALSTKDFDVLVYEVATGRLALNLTNVPVVQFRPPPPTLNC